MCLSNTTNHWDKNIPSIFIAQTSFNVTKQFLETKKFLFDSKADLFHLVTCDLR